MLTQIDQLEETPNPDLHAISEEAASVLLQVLLERRVVAVRNESVEILSTKSLSHVCRFNTGSSLYIKGEFLPNKKQLRKRLIDLPRALLSITDANVEKGVVPDRQESFTLFAIDEDGFWGKIGEAKLALTPPGSLNKLARLSERISITLLYVISVRMKIALILTIEQLHVLMEKEELRLSDSETDALIYYKENSFSGFFLTRTGYVCFVVSKRRENMNKHCAEVFPTLDLGSLEMSLGDFIKLRSGSTLRFKKPEIFEGELCIGGTNWARVQIDIQSEEIKLKVLELGPNLHLPQVRNDKQIFQRDPDRL